jgi:hypothetical protein
MPLAAALPFIIGAGISAGGAVIGGELAGRQSSQEKGLLSQEQINAQQAGGIASTLAPEGEKNLDTAQNFWQSVMSGGQAETTALAPSINNITSQYGAAEKSALQFAPRGGGQQETLSQLPLQKANAITNLQTNLAAQAPNELAQIGEVETQQAISALSGSTASSASALNFLQQQSDQSIQVGNSIGTGLGSLLYYYLNSQNAQKGTNNAGVITNLFSDSTDALAAGA